MPHKGYRPTTAHRRALADAKHRYHQRVKDAVAAYIPPTKPKKVWATPVPLRTPIPPSASSISSDHLTRYGIYSFNEPGQYYYKREQADTPTAMTRLIRDLSLPYPLWAYLKSARTEAELTLPIRIPLSAIPALGQRFMPLKEKK